MKSLKKLKVNGGILSIAHFVGGIMVPHINMEARIDTAYLFTKSPFPFMPIYRATYNIVQLHSLEWLFVRGMESLLVEVFLYDVVIDFPE